MYIPFLKKRWINNKKHVSSYNDKTGRFQRDGTYDNYSCGFNSLRPSDAYMRQ